MPSPFPTPFRDSPFVNAFPLAGPAINQMSITPPASMTPPEASLERALNYYADYSGCGFWRMIWPEHLLNACQKMVMHGSTVMTFDRNYFHNVKAVRIQRQATEHQLVFVKFLRELADQNKFRLIYEIDDVIFSEDIPDYNKFKPAFVDPKIRKISQEIMSMCDEITVTCDFMKQYYASKTGHANITVIPNYPPKFWMGNYFNQRQLEKNYELHCTTRKGKPRILYPGSGAHFDVENRTNQNDDFAHVRDVIRATVDKFQWVFIGAFPIPLQDLVREGKIEFHPWKRLYEYPEMIYKLNCNMMIAPLQDNNFNKAKSDLKYIEASCYGLPIACQDIDTYSNAPIRFKTGPEMIDRIVQYTKNSSKYWQASLAGRKVAETRFLELENNINKYHELYTLPFKDPKRVLLNSINL